MPLPLNSVVQVTWGYTYAGQTYLNVTNYEKFNMGSFIGDEVTEETLLAVFLATGGVGTFSALIRACLPNNCTLVDVRVQAIRPVRIRSVRSSILGVGTWASPAGTGNMSGVISRQTNFSGRNQQGSFHIPALPENTIGAGLITSAPYIAAMQALSVQLTLGIITVLGGPAYRPIIKHPVNRVPPTDIATIAFPQQTVRVMRRRTIGVGR